jgi:hypothetical protein
MTFQKAAEPIMPTPVMPMPPSSAPPPPPPPAWDSGPPPVPTTAGGTRLDQLTLILVCVGLGFLLLFAIGILLPWYKATVQGINVPDTKQGIGTGIGIFLFLMTLLALGAVVTALVLSFVSQNAVLVSRFHSYSVLGAAWLGTLAFFCLLAGVITPWGVSAEVTRSAEAMGVRIKFGNLFGVWLAFLSAMVICGVFVFLSLRRLPELPVSPDPNSFVRKWLLFVSVVGFAAFLGLLLFIIHIV